MSEVVAGLSVTVKTTLNKFDGEAAPDKDPVETLERSDQGFLVEREGVKYLLTPAQHDQYLLDGIIPDGTQLPS